MGNFLPDPELLRAKLKLRHFQSQNLLTAKYPKIAGLLTSASKAIASGAAITGLSLSSAGGINPLIVSANPHAIISPQDLERSFREKLQGILPKDVVPLSEIQENTVSDLLHDQYGIHATAKLEGNRLKDSYGFIGAEQHLPRYPGDSVYQHDRFKEAGITPGRGAWGYFAWSKDKMTEDLVEKEKYYVAVQTLYLDDYTERLAYYRDWFKLRKVVVVNPRSGRAIVAVIADAGPAWWTGKKFGGSPEVMDYLQSRDGKQKGPVILFFVDDPQGEVPLGPLEQNLEGQNIKLLT